LKSRRSDVRSELSGVEITALAVPAGQTLSLVGGTLNLGAAEVRDANGQISQDAMPANLAAPGGRVNLVSVASAGEAVFDGTGFDVDGFAQLGDINITGGDIRTFGSEFLFASVVDGKDVFIRGGRLVMHDGLISPGLNAFFTPSPDGGEVNIRVSGDVFTQAGSFLTPELIPDAKVPDITIEAGSSFTLSGAASVKTDRLGPGAPAEVVIKADTVTVKDGASIVSLNFFEGPGSNITIDARQVELSNDGTASPTGIAGVSAQNLVHPSTQNLVFPCCDVVPPGLTFADAGSITVNAAETVSVLGDALILTDSLGLGRGGDITINTGDLAVIGAGAETAGIKGQTAFAGNAGNITINASGAIELRDGGQIAGTTVGSGKGSSVTVTAGGAITFSGPDSRIVNATAPLPLDQLNELFEFSFGKSFETLRGELGLPADADVFDVLGALTGIPGLAAGDAGALSIGTPALTLNADTRIEMSTGWEGNAGVVQANVGTLSLNNGGAMNSRSGIERLTGEVVVGSGNAGAINVTATGTISISGAGSTISTSTLGDGDGGDIALTAANQVTISGGGSVTSDSLGGAGLTGDIAVSSENNIVISGGAISTRAQTSDGGNVKLTAPNIVQLTNAEITTSVESGVGGGGNISIDPQFIVLNKSQITANAFGGPGGNITLIANNFLPSADSLVQASSALSTQGTIVVASPENNIAGAIAQLPQDIRCHRAAAAGYF
jgi:large exoprotein involved in heme utilization and adhesion